MKKKTREAHSHKFIFFSYTRTVVRKEVHAHKQKMQSSLYDIQDTFVFHFIYSSIQFFE